MRPNWPKPARLPQKTGHFSRFRCKCNVAAVKCLLVLHYTVVYIFFVIIEPTPEFFKLAETSYSGPENLVLELFSFL